MASLEKDILENQLQDDAWSQVMLIVGTMAYMNTNSRISSFYFDQEMVYLGQNNKG